MQAVRALAERRPIVFVIALAIVLPLIAFPLVAAFRLSGQDIVPLRAVIPVVQSVFVLFIVWALGWRARAGLVGTVRDVHLLWFPTLVAFVPVFFYGTIEISWG